MKWVKYSGLKKQIQKILMNFDDLNPLTEMFLLKARDLENSISQEEYKLFEKHRMQSYEIKQGYLITFEGGEGCGKSTQVKLLQNYLIEKGVDAVVNREPGGLKIGEAIRSVLLDKQYDKTSLQQLLLFEASRCEYINNLVIPALNEGKVFISDRLGDSSMVYQGIAGGLGLGFVDYFNLLATRNIIPNLTILLDVPVKIGLQRAGKVGSKDFFESKNLEFHENLRNGYLTLAKQNKDRIKKINGNKSIEKCHNKIVKIVESNLFK